MGEMFEAWHKMASRPHLTPIITHRFVTDDFATGFEVMRSREQGKVILD